MRVHDHAESGEEAGAEFVTVRLYAEDARTLAQLVALCDHRSIAVAYRAVCAGAAERAKKKAMRKELSGAEVGGEG